LAGKAGSTTRKRRCAFGMEGLDSLAEIVRGTQLTVFELDGERQGRNLSIVWQLLRGALGQRRETPKFDNRGIRGAPGTGRAGCARNAERSSLPLHRLWRHREGDDGGCHPPTARQEGQRCLISVAPHGLLDADHEGLGPAADIGACDHRGDTRRRMAA
jgi:hypothetical protein